MGQEDTEDALERISDVEVFEHLPSSHQELRDASDEELIRLIFAFDGDFLEGTSSLTSNAMATFILRERGYTVDGDYGNVCVVDDDGRSIQPTDVFTNTE